MNNTYLQYILLDMYKIPKHPHDPKKMLLILTVIGIILLSKKRK